MSHSELKTTKKPKRGAGSDCETDEGELLTGGGVENVDVGVDVGVIGAGHLDEGGGGEDQDVGAGGVLWCAQLGRLHVQGGAAAKHRAG